jgi:hypothetical protein
LDDLGKNVTNIINICKKYFGDKPECTKGDVNIKNLWDLS